MKVGEVGWRGEGGCSWVEGWSWVKLRGRVEVGGLTFGNISHW